MLSVPSLIERDADHRQAFFPVAILVALRPSEHSVWSEQRSVHLPIQPGPLHVYPFGVIRFTNPNCNEGSHNGACYAPCIRYGYPRVNLVFSRRTRRSSCPNNIYTTRSTPYQKKLPQTTYITHATHAMTTPRTTRSPLLSQRRNSGRGGKTGRQNLSQSQ